MTKEIIKLREIEICEFYNWNIAFVTFYDYLREFLNLGVLEDRDEVKMEGSELHDQFASNGSGTIYL
jgi:hypothetical protein